MLLDPAARALFRRMGCFIGPFTFDAAHAVAAGRHIGRGHDRGARRTGRQVAGDRRVPRRIGAVPADRIDARVCAGKTAQRGRVRAHRGASRTIRARARARGGERGRRAARRWGRRSTERRISVCGHRSTERRNSRCGHGSAERRTSRSINRRARPADATPVPEADRRARCWSRHGCTNARRGRAMLDAFDTAAADPVDAAREMRLRAACASALLHTDGDAVAAAAMWDRTLGLAARSATIRSMRARWSGSGIRC